MKNYSTFIKCLFGLLLMMAWHSYASAASVVPEMPPGSSTTNITICNNQLPYQWNNITCLTAGTYSATLAGSTGDSIAVLNLSVLNVSTSITNAIVCNNELPYIWNGNSYSTNGTYSVTLTNSSGCDSVPILSLTVNDVVTSMTNRTVCSNQLPYNWNGNNYPAAGLYVVTLTSAAGCDSLASLNLTVNPVSSSTTAAAVCNSQLPYNWNGNSYPAPGTYSITLLNSQGCDSVATLTLTAVASVTSSTTVSVCSNQLPYNWNSNNYAAAGNYSVTLTGSSGCDSIATLHLTVNPIRTSTTNITICTGQLPFNWNGNNYAAAGSFTVTLTGSNGCDSVARLNLTTVSFYSSTTNHSICNSELPYVWNGNSYAAAGTYTVTFTTSAGCDSVATLNLAVQTPQVGTDSLTICESALPFSYHGFIFSAGGTYQLVPPAIIDPCNSVDTLVLMIQLVVPGTTTATVCTNQLPYLWNGNSYSVTGTYGVLLTSSSGCDSLANLNLTVNPFSSSISNITICNNQLPFNWNGNNCTGTGQYVVILTSANGCDSICTLNLTVNAQTSSTTDITACISQLPYNWNGNSYSTNGTYAVTLTNSAGCDSIATLHFTILPFLTSTTSLSLCSSQLPYSWNGNNYSVAGVYSINLVSSAGCDSVATLDLVINDVITSTTNINTCSNLLPYTWNGNSYNASGTYIATLVNSGGCDSVATLNLTVGATTSSFTEITICNNQLPFSWNGNSFAIEGVYPVTLTNSSGCDSVATLHLIVTDILTSTTNVNICPALLPYQWNGNSYNAGGTYSVTLSNSAGCDSVPILSLTIVPYVTSTTDLTICNNDLPFTWNGNTYPSAGTYSVLLTGLSVCDSLAILNLDVLPAITSTTTASVCDNQLPYTWNGNSYAAAGLYQITLSSSGGCDSTANLILSVFPTTTSISSISICDTQLPFFWNGNSYSAAGTYTVTLTGSAGCDSTATLLLLVNPVSTSITDATICTTQLPYSWNGNIYPAAGSYSVTLTGSTGCDSIATLNLIANPVLSSNTLISTCNNQLPFSWNGNNYSTAGSYSITLTGAGGCDSIATLILTINSVVSSNSAVTICNNQLPYNWNGQSYNNAGTYSATLVSSSGCDSIATLLFSVNNVTTSSTIASTCSNQVPYNWNGQSYSNPGAYSVTLVNSSGCDSVATLQLTINPVLTSITNTSICSSELPFIWNGNSYSTFGNYVVTLTASSGCDSVATLELTVNPTPPAPTVQSPVVYCQYQSTVALQATATNSGNQLLWYSSPSGGSGSSTAPVPSAVNAGITNYYVSQVEGVCEGPRAMITVTVNSKPDLGPDKLLKICFGDSANLASSFNTTGFNVNWTQNQLPVSAPINIQVAGDYQLIVQNSNGCSDTASASLFIQPQLIANAGSDGDAEYNIPYQLQGSGGGDYLWLPSAVLNDPYISNPTAVLSANTNFVLMVSDDIGCTAFDTVKIRVLNGPTFYVPSAFTPNADGLNDIFKPTPVGIRSLDFFRVFNRFGELVFETNVIGKGWDGTYKGVKQNIGNYVWSLRGTDRTGETKILKGNVVLIR